MVNADSMQLYRRHGHRHRQADPRRAGRRAAPRAGHLGRSPSRRASPSTSGWPARRSTTSWPAAGCRCWSAAPACTCGRCWRTSSSPAPTRDAGPAGGGVGRGGPGAAARAAARRRTRPRRERILPGNGRRIVRALEVIELTGAPFTASLPDPTPYYPVGAARRRPGHRRAGRADRGAGRPDVGGRAGRRGTRRWWRRACGTGGRPAGRSATSRCWRLLDGELHRGRRRTTRRSGPPAGSSAGSAPGSAATRGSSGWTAAIARPDRGRRCVWCGGCGDDGARVQFTKGHGTGNDFVILPDPDGQLDADPGAGRGALRPAARHRRRRRAAGGARGQAPGRGRVRRRGRVVHGLLERRRLVRRDVRQRRPGLRPLPGRHRPGRAGAGGLPVATRAGVVRALVGGRVDLRRHGPTPGVRGQHGRHARRADLARGRRWTAATRTWSACLPAGVDLAGAGPHPARRASTRRSSRPGSTSSSSCRASRSTAPTCTCGCGSTSAARPRRCPAVSGACAVAAVALRDAGRTPAWSPWTCPAAG